MSDIAITGYGALIFGPRANGLDGAGGSDDLRGRVVRGLVAQRAPSPASSSEAASPPLPHLDQSRTPSQS